MIIGPAYWRCFTSDTPGVPRGGVYGEVSWFEEHCEEYGLKLAWSWLHHCFMVFSRRGAKWHLQERYRRDFGHGYDGLVPLTQSHFWLLIFLWMRCCKTDFETVKLKREQMERDYDARMEAEWQVYLEEIKSDVMRKVALRRGLAPPRVISVPKKIVTRHGLELQKQRNRFRKRRIILPHEVN